MILVFTEKTQDEREKITAFHFQPDSLSEEVKQQGYFVEEGSETAPSLPEHSTRQYLPYYDKTTEEVVWELTEPDLDLIIERTFEFGQSLLKRFAKENTQLGITQAGETSRVRAVMRDVRDALLDGSPNDAITELDMIAQEDFDDTFITQARIDEYKNKILEFLGKSTED